VGTNVGTYPNRTCSRGATASSIVVTAANLAAPSDRCSTVVTPGFVSLGRPLLLLLLQEQLQLPDLDLEMVPI